MSDLSKAAMYQMIDKQMGVLASRTIQRYGQSVLRDLTGGLSQGEKDLIGGPPELERQLILDQLEILQLTAAKIIVDALASRTIQRDGEPPSQSETKLPPTKPGGAPKENGN